MVRTPNRRPVARARLRGVRRLRPGWWRDMVEPIVSISLFGQSWLEVCKEGSEFPLA